MTIEEYEERNRSSFWSPSSFRDFVRDGGNFLDIYKSYNYRGYTFHVPYNVWQSRVQYEGASRDLWNSWKNSVEENVDRKIANGTMNRSSTYGTVSSSGAPLTFQDVVDYGKDLLDEVGLSGFVSSLGLDNGSSSKSSYVPSSSSASGVQSGTAESSIFSDYEKYLNYLKDINNSNNAFNIEQAQKQMDFQAQQNQILMDFNAEEAMKSRNWQEYMSNTAHQREQADLKAAGLNPILAVSGGNGAAIGSGAAASSGGSPSGARASADNVFASAMLSMFNSAMDVAEKNASAAITANAVAARGISSDSGFNFKKVLSGVKDFLSVARGIKGLFS